MRRLVGVIVILLWVGRVATARAEDGPRLEWIAEDGARAAMPMVGSDMQVTVRGAIAQVRHRQRFANPAARPIEAIYVFPLHERAAVGGMTMRIGPRLTVAKIMRRKAAQAVYDAAKAAGKTASLLTQERPNVFTQAVTGILPGEAIDVELTYDILLAPEHGWYELALPTVVGPRYIPGTATGRAASGTGAAPDTDQVPDASRITPPSTSAGEPPQTGFGFRLDLDAGVPVVEVDCPTHQMLGTDLGATHVVVELARPHEVATKDVVVRWRTEVTAPTVAVAAGRGADGGYVTATLVPPALTGMGPRPRRELVFVLDTSGSMGGAPMALMREGILYALDRLGPDDTFRIINFSSSVAGFESGAVREVRRETLARARQFVEQLDTAGGTEMLAGVKAALADPPTDGRLRYVCFMTDGFIGNDAEIIAAIDRLRSPSTHLFAFGVGSSVNRALLDQMARAGHGASQVLLLDDPPMPQLARFFAQLAAPMWADVKIAFDGVEVTDLTPAAPGDLFLGQPLVVAGRYRAGGTGQVRVTATVNGRPVILEHTIALPDAGGDGALVGRLWARTRIRDLSYGARGGLADDAEEAITQIALAHALVSKHTAFVAVDQVRRTAGRLSTLPVPVETPAGVSFSGSTSIENQYIVDGVNASEVITISGSPPSIDTTATTQGITIDAEYTQNIPLPGRTFESMLGAAAGAQGDGSAYDGFRGGHDGSGRASAELLARGGVSLDGDRLGALALQLGLRVTPRLQLGVEAALTWRADETTHIGMWGLLTRWGMWRRLSLRLGLGGDGALPTPTALAWRAELLHPLGEWHGRLPMLSVGVLDVRGDGRAPTPTLGVGVRF